MCHQRAGPRLAQCLRRGQARTGMARSRITGTVTRQLRSTTAHPVSKTGRLRVWLFPGSSCQPAEQNQVKMKSAAESPVCAISTGACRPDWSHPWSPLLGHVRRKCLCRCQSHLKLPSIAAPMLRGEPQMHSVLRRHWVGLSPKTFAAEWQGGRLGLRSPFHIPLRTMNHRHIAEPHCPGRPICRVSTQGWSRRRHLPG